MLRLPAPASRQLQRALKGLATCALCLLTWMVPAAAMVDEGGPYAGRLLVDVLDQLRAAGTNLVYSDALIPDDWVVSDVLFLLVLYMILLFNKV